MAFANIRWAGLKSHSALLEMMRTFRSSMKVSCLFETLFIQGIQRDSDMLSWIQFNRIGIMQLIVIKGFF
ncbi:thymidylate synthase [Pseudomonas sp. FW306-02-F02-AA]|uniref:Uncharacterized protein n=1 Tax=Pseudomonas fluorescens TaxID=294 RepID=A0A0N9WCN7_PSEFL|nr:hypothetical protein AO353_01035 [Pseudomonas fluorescens]PMZ02848.1 thymidylate synthase [Pseudomonas sp. FW306-02-F02-AB]PMZ08453.1 thymidylate synthase [Pseudomonas sp. FW306-02-H06C]PMZ13863.1 thymidylate synthase [Pseudomonas sp. FW306-02-F02-AA]PMZ20543.1 thymidylate synthase [Pseudomonas sp. FW306-02-F08-AA]PMZ24229.1 thymidylate synthase [Pseudomonas sp. FW306-02-F04-BA]PMZ33184.1 thymidylate synthase [Pseudomonas sp. FW306-02-H06B]PMZ39014.1 thymidylate synthase [Pseudomonas sp. 